MAHGVSCIVNYATNYEDAEALVNEAGQGAVAVQVDIVDDRACRACEAAIDAFDRIDVLISNFGRAKFAAHKDLDALDAKDLSTSTVEYGRPVSGGPCRRVGLARQPKWRGSQRRQRRAHMRHGSTVRSAADDVAGPNQDAARSSQPRDDRWSLVASIAAGISASLFHVVWDRELTI